MFVGNLKYKPNDIFLIKAKPVFVNAPFHFANNMFQNEKISKLTKPI